MIAYPEIDPVAVSIGPLSIHWYGLMYLIGIASAGTWPGGFGGGAGGGRGGGSENFQTGPQTGISTTHAYGLNYSDEWGEKVRVTGSYFFNLVNNENDQIVNRENFVPNSANQFYEELSNSNRVNYNNRFNMRLIYTINERNSIIFSPRVSWQTTTLNDILTGQTSSDEGAILNALVNDYYNKSNGYNAQGNLLFRHRFEKRGRTISLNFGLQANDNTGNAYLDNITVFDPDLLGIDSLQQQTDLLANGITYSGNINFTEPLGKRMQMQFGYRVSLNNTDSDKRTFDASEGIESIMPLDTTLSNVFSSEYITQSPSVGIMYRQEKLFFRAGFAYQSALLDNQQLFPQEGETSTQYNSYLPSAMIRYRFSKDANGIFFYRTFTQNPSIEQLQNVIDFTNPLYLATGNPNLNQSTSHMLMARFSKVNTEKSTSFFVLASLRIINDYITNTTYVASADSLINGDVLLRKGWQLSAPINLNGYANGRLLFTYGIPISAAKSNLNFNLGATYIRTPGLVNRIENTSHTVTYNGGLVFSSNISQNVDYTFVYDLNYNTVENNVETNLSNNYLSQVFRFKLNWIFWKGFVFRNNVSYQVYNGYTEGFNDNYVLWNMSIAKKLLAKKQAELEFRVFDLLSQNTTINRINTENYIEEIRTDVLQQYFMLTFTYTFKNFKGFVDLQDQKRPGPGGGRRW